MKILIDSWNHQIIQPTGRRDTPAACRRQPSGFNRQELDISVKDTFEEAAADWAMAAPDSDDLDVNGDETKKPQAPG